MAKFFNIFTKGHSTNPIPNMILFGSVGGGIGVKISYDDQIKTHDVYRKLDIPAKPISEVVFTFAKESVTGGALGAFYGYTFGPVLFSICVGGSIFLGTQTVFTYAKNIFTVSS